MIKYILLGLVLGVPLIVLSLYVDGVFHIGWYDEQATVIASNVCFIQKDNGIQGYLDNPGPCNLKVGERITIHTDGHWDYLK